MKPKRVENTGLLAAIRTLPCLACSNDDPVAARSAIGECRGTHPHHIISRGAGGPDVASNVMPLCFRHHQEIHNKGLAWMAERYQTIYDWLKFAGWGCTPMEGWVIEWEDN